MAEKKAAIRRPVTKGVAKVPVVMQLEALECGAASLAMVMAYYGKWVPLEQVRSECGVSRDGSNAKNIAVAAAESGVDAASYLAFNAAYGSLMGAFMSLAGLALKAATIKPILEMAEPLLNEEPEVSDNREIVTAIEGGIEMNNVFFRYTEKMPYVVNDMSLKINPGEYIAIVGRTGCGKSTLMRLLLGFEKPERGALYYDDKDINTLDLCSLRRKIGVVTQNGGLFQGDLCSNILISAPDLTVKDAWEAAEKAGIADDIRAMPMGMQTLDNKTQKQVSEALDQMGCTRIVIAHRLSTIRNCDRILFLEGGKIAEDGTYDELIAKGGLFADLVERQRLDTGAQQAQ